MKWIYHVLSSTKSEYKSNRIVLNGHVDIETVVLVFRLNNNKVFGSTMNWGG